MLCKFLRGLKPSLWGWPFLIQLLALLLLFRATELFVLALSQVCLQSGGNTGLRRCVRNLPGRIRIHPWVDSGQYFDHVDVASNTAVTGKKAGVDFSCLFFFLSQGTEKSGSFSADQSLLIKVSHQSFRGCCVSGNSVNKMSMTFKINFSGDGRDLAFLRDS